MRYRLSEQDLAELNRLLASLQENPAPDWAREKEPGVYEFFHAGYWIGYTTMMIGGERVIIVGAMEQN
jgi:hypothetical protein